MHAGRLHPIQSSRSANPDRDDPDLAETPLSGGAGVKPSFGGENP